MIRRASCVALGEQIKKVHVIHDTCITFNAFTDVYAASQITFATQSV